MILSPVKPGSYIYRRFTLSEGCLALLLSLIGVAIFQRLTQSLNFPNLDLFGSLRVPTSRCKDWEMESTGVGETFTLILPSILGLYVSSSRVSDVFKGLLLAVNLE